MNNKIIVILTICITILLFYGSIQPSNNRNWTDDQKVLSYANIDGDNIKVFNIRNFSYQTTQNYTASYYNKTYNLNEITNLYYVVEPFGGFDGIAHTFVSFEFNTKEYLAISIEVRKEKGEEFSGIKGLFKKYELMYVVGDENDLIKLRSNYRNDSVFIYPVNTTKEKTQRLLISMLERVNQLKETPEFYNTLTSTCTTNLMKHINEVTPEKIPVSYKILLPGFSDSLAQDIKLIPQSDSIEKLREKYKINKKSQIAKDDPNYSSLIRQL
ncbi:MAG: hypothetical protein ACI83O_000646 [Patescibacteria group bacterium]|jgi:hypothetical protein